MMKLSKAERYSLSNQLRILEALYPDEAEDLAVQREALERGYEFIYEMNISQTIDDDDIMSTDECKEVWDTMDMFLSIDRTIEALGSEGLEDFHLIRFAGYDGNNESKFMAFASYTVERLKRFTHLPLREPDYFNSHMPMRDAYQRMLSEWKKIPFERRFPMSRENLELVLGAAIHPEHRG